VRVWVADRGAGRLIGLDGDLFVARRLAVEHPVAIALRPDGGLWVASALDGHPRGRHRLELVSPAGEGCPIAELGALLDLEAVAGGGVLAVHTAGGHTLVEGYDAGGSRLDVLAVPGAACAAGRPGRTLVGTSDGRLLSAGTERPAQRALGRCFVDLAPDAAPDRWWALDTGPPSRLLLVDGGLAIVSEHYPGPASALALAPGPAGERVWVLGADRRSVLRLGPGGAPELAQVRLPMRGVEAIAATPAGGLLAAAPGALLRLDAGGRGVPGQGGFDHLVAVRCRP